MDKSVCTSRKRISSKILNKMTSRSAKEIDIDVVGPMKWISLGKARYFVTAVHEHSGFSLVCFINSKSEIAIVAIDMIREIEILFNLKIETLTCFGPKYR